jgi:hypothetical protein
MSSEVMELSRIICNRCDQKEYEKCRTCRIYVLMNKIAAK